MTIEEIEAVLEVYTLEEIIEDNQLEVSDVLFFLLEQEFLILPNPVPL